MPTSHPEQPVTSQLDMRPHARDVCTEKVVLLLAEEHTEPLHYKVNLRVYHLVRLVFIK